jgi:hypothetical protein
MTNIVIFRNKTKKILRGYVAADLSAECHTLNGFLFSKEILSISSADKSVATSC